MTIKRSDYNLARTKKIYEEYVTTSTSYNKLAKKYGISPQRIAYLIKDYKGKGLHNALKVDDPKSKREKQKDLAVELREKGKVTLAIDMLDDVIEWDEHNDNLRGKMDVLGHKKIAYLNLVDSTSDKALKTEYFDAALACSEEALNIAKKLKDIPEGPKLTQYVHYASLLLHASQFSSEKSSAAQRRMAVENLDKALKDKFPGSKAHSAWPLSIKAKALHMLGQTEQAYDLLLEAQKCLFEGYTAELKGADQAELKLRVWSSGIFLGLAKIYIDSDQPILAEINLQAVINTPDPKGILKARKKEAKELLSKL